MNWEDAARARWSSHRHLWVSGNGPFALVVKCQRLRVQLFETREEAEAMRFRYELTGCGLSCPPAYRKAKHQIVDLGAA